MHRSVKAVCQLLNSPPRWPAFRCQYARKRANTPLSVLRLRPPRNSSAHWSRGVYPVKVEPRQPQTRSRCGSFFNSLTSETHRRPSVNRLKCGYGTPLRVPSSPNCRTGMLHVPRQLGDGTKRRLPDALPIAELIMDVLPKAVARLQTWKLVLIAALAGALSPLAMPALSGHGPSCF